MPRTILLCLCFIAITFTAKADTIDYWHVYLNGQMLKSYNQYLKGDVVLQLNKLGKKDTLTIYYYRDTPCSDCLTKVEFKSEQNRVIASGTNTGTGNPIKIALNDILLYNKANRKAVLGASYYEENNGKQKPLTSLFKVIIN